MSDRRSIFITGASSGFGRDAALALAGRNHTVFATMRGVDGKNASTASDMKHQGEENGWDLHVLELDVTDEASVNTAVEAAVAEAGWIDVVINNAGVGTFGVQEAFPVEQVQQVFDVNVFGVMRVNRAVLPHMRRRGEGHIIYISSGLGRFVFPFVGPYAGTKFALEAMAEAASYELTGEGIDTTIVQPGAFGTAFGDNMMQAKDRARLETYGPARQMFTNMAETFASNPRQDPKVVEDALVKLAESGRGERPLRLPVGEDVTPVVGPMNDMQADAQTAIMAHFGFD
jgi:NAD(P)-dependent dehydrogenase (short-subunit alcohol dehydrogenase family)